MARFLITLLGSSKQNF